MQVLHNSRIGDFTRGGQVIIHFMRMIGQVTIDRLLHYVTRAPDDELKEFLKDTDAAALVNGKAEGTAANIRTNTVAFIRSLRFVPQGRQQFSIREWVERDAGKDWIFLNARPNQLPSVRPLLSMWLQVFATNLMGLPDSQIRPPRISTSVLGENTMKLLSRIPRWSLIAAMALIAGVAGFAALHLVSGGDRPYTAMRDPLKPDASVADETGEVAIKKFSSVTLQHAEEMAEKQFGPMPQTVPATELARASEFDGGTQALSDLQRIRELRRTQGSAAAVAAMKTLRPAAAP